MLAFAFAAAAAASQPNLPQTHSVVEQARATVRIVSGARVTAERIPPDAIVRETKVRSADGSQTTSRLVEFP